MILIEKVSTLVFTGTIVQNNRQLITQIGIIELGKEIRLNEIFAPEGTNVDFVQMLDTNTISMRTYERGVEDETLACGTGSVACAIISSIVKGILPPINVKTRGGEILTINFTQLGDLFHKVTLQGSAKIIYRGELIYSDAEKRIY